MAELTLEGLAKRVEELEANQETHLGLIKKLSEKPEEKTEVKEPAKKLVTPEATFKVGDTEYKFTAPNFYHKNKLYVSEEVMADTKANAALLKELVENQTHKGGEFSEGLLKKAN